MYAYVEYYHTGLAYQYGLRGYYVTVSCRGTRVTYEMPDHRTANDFAEWLNDGVRAAWFKWETHDKRDAVSASA